MSTGPQRLGKYELLQQLGRGNVGEVWKAYDFQLQRDVAIKILHTYLQSDSSFLARFTSEGQSITALHHDNIVQVREVALARSPQFPESSEPASTTAYIVSDYIEGLTLAQYIDRTSHKGEFPSLSDIVYLFTSLGVAVDYAHQRGIVHGDIKPNNILLDKKHTLHLAAGEPMLTDFGLPLLLGESSGLIGTPYYMSPEQAKGYPPNNRSDIYSLGVILYELCTGVHPFRDESSVAVLMQHINTLPTPPLLINPQLPPALSEVILRAMAKDTATRFPLASLLAAAIADACSIRPPISLPRIPIAEEVQAYHTASGPYTSLLGVSSPVPAYRPISQPMPRIAPRIASLSQPLPAVAQQTSSPQLPTISGKQRSINPTQDQSSVTKKIPMVSPSSVSPVSTMSGKIAIPGLPQQSPTSMPSNPTHPPVLPTTPFPTFPRRQSRLNDLPMYAAIAITALIVIIIGGVVGGLLLNQRAQTGTIVGHVFFQDDAFGHADTLRIEMQNIAAPSQSQSYQAWLRSTTSSTVPLGSLTLNNSSATLLYPGNSQHTNLLSIAQSVLVTLENNASKSSSPKGNVVYQASFDTASFQYIKNILYRTPHLPSNNSVIVGLFETIKSINDKAGSLVDSIQGTHDLGLARRQAIRIIELVDGSQYARSSGDLPSNRPSYVYARVGLLSSPAQPGYIDILAEQLDRLQSTARNNPGLLQHIQNAKNAVADLSTWIQQLRIYDTQLVKGSNLTSPQLVDAALHLKQVAADSYTGRTIPPNDSPQPILGSAAAYQASIECQYLATLDMKRV